MKFPKAFLNLFLIFVIYSCNDKKVVQNLDIDTILVNAESQLALQLAVAEHANRIPRTITPEGEMHWTKPNFDWTEGFFPGSC